MQWSRSMKWLWSTFPLVLGPSCTHAQRGGLTDTKCLTWRGLLHKNGSCDHTCDQTGSLLSAKVCSFMFRCRMWMVFLFPEVLLVTLQPASQMKWSAPGWERQGQRGNKPETRGFPAWAFKLAYCFFFLPLCWYSREVAVIFTVTFGDSSVSHDMWVGASAAIRPCRVVFAAPSPLQ